MVMKHKHHKIPKHMGGTDDESNLYECSIEEHAELHLSLYLEHGHWEDWYAAMGLSGIIGKEELVAQVCRTAAQQPRSEEFKKKISAANRRRGPMSEETKRRISESKKGKPAWNKGIPFETETRQRMSKAAKQRASTPEYKERMRKVMTDKPRKRNPETGRFST